ncbi:hypothetical protein P4H94_07950 [Paenibacillus macerans]|uniref:hypothetical protein n=1 Tax=Paenibacillus macerans TaxID=44252 RepID=UPI002DB6D734|nr:hypothetical protein [Paenibacillus macerans]MEC0136801.1 hypothetical protein [Paenibacillus macerans]
MKFKSMILVLITLCLFTLTACEPKTSQSGGEKAGSNTNIPTDTETFGNTDSSYDLNNPVFLKKFIAYFDMDKDMLIEKLAQDYEELPIEETDSDTGLTSLKLEKAGMIFHLTGDDGVPVSHVDINGASPIHYTEARSNMSFSDIMKRAGETMILAEPSTENEDRKQFSIIYPLQGVSVVFIADNVYDNSSKMKVSSWGYYDVEPTLLSPREIHTLYGLFTIPETWVGRISLEDLVNKQVISFLNERGSFPLIQIESLNLTEWNDLKPNQRDSYQIVSKGDDWVVVAKILSQEPSNKEDAQVYQSMQKEVKGMLATFKPDNQEDESNGSNNIASYSCNNENMAELTQVGQVSQIFEKFSLEKWEDQSEAGMDEAYSEFGKCFTTKVNEMVADDGTLNNLVNKLRANISDLNSDWYEYQYYLNGGGTMWSHMSTRQGSMIDAAIYGHLVQLQSNEGQRANKEKYSELLQQLSEYREHYNQTSAQAMNDEDQTSLEEVSERLVSSYDRLATVLKGIAPNQAGVDLLQFLVGYDEGE